MTNIQTATAALVARGHLDAARAWLDVVWLQSQGPDFVARLVEAARTKSRSAIKYDFEAFGSAVSIKPDSMEQIEAHLRDAEAHAAMTWHVEAFQDVIDAIHVNEGA